MICLWCGRPVNKTGRLLYVVPVRQDGEDEERGVCGKPRRCEHLYNTDGGETNDDD